MIYKEREKKKFIVFQKVHIQLILGQLQYFYYLKQQIHFIGCIETKQKELKQWKCLTKQKLTNNQRVL